MRRSSLHHHHVLPRMRTTTSADGRRMLVLLIAILLVGCVAVQGRRCEVTGIRASSDVLNSTYAFNLTYKDGSCTNKRKLGLKLEICDGKCSRGFRIGVKDEGSPLYCPCDGWWRVVTRKQSQTIHSECFQCVGLVMESPITVDLNLAYLRIKVKDAHPRLDTWKITIYKTTKQHMVCKTTDTYITPMSEIQRRFQVSQLQPSNISPTEITMNHTFDADTCYCIVMEPVSQLLLEPKYMAVSSKNNSCTPDPVLQKDGKYQTDAQIMSKWQVIVLAVVLGIVFVAAGTLAVIINKPQILSKIIGLRRLIVRQEGSSGNSVVPGNVDVMLLHAPDVSGSKPLAHLKHHLQAAFKVHDLFDRGDIQRLNDANGWMEARLLPSAGVKLLVESKEMEDVINSLLTLDAENPGTAKVTHTSTQAKTGDTLLTYALNTILCTNLREDYSTVFVVRFSDEVKEDVGHFLVHSRRYKFPDHIEELTQAMRKASWGLFENDFLGGPSGRADWAAANKAGCLYQTNQTHLRGLRW